MRFYEDLDSVLDKLQVARQAMFKYGMFRRDDPSSLRQEMLELRRKVPKGSALRIFMQT